MKNIIKIFLITPILISTITYSQISSRKIDKLVAEAMNTFNVAGCAVGVVKDGEVFHTKGYGIKSIETNESVNKHTNFAIASNTKAFTTTALSILVDEEKLNWNDKVIDIIPEFKMYNEYVTQNFIIKDLVTHRSGLGLGAGDLQIWPTGTDFTMDDILTNFQYFEPTSPLRTKYDYDNILYVVAGEVIKRISGLSWEEYVNQYIFKPLNMDNSYSNYNQIEDFSNLSDPHLSEFGKLEIVEHFKNEPEKINGAWASILSNVDDFSKWMLVHLNKGKYGDDLQDTLFSYKNHREMWKLHTVYNADTSSRYNSHFSGYGLGWFLTDMRGELIVRHGGYLAGMLSRTVMIPDMKFGIVVLTNTELSGGLLTRSVINTIVDKFIGVKNKDWIKHYHERSQKSDAKGDSVTTKVWETVGTAYQGNITLEEYVGTYEDKWFGKVEIFLKDDILWFKSQRSPKLFGPMYFYKANAFAIKWERRELMADAFAIFSLDEEGIAQSFKMKGISPNIDFSYDFQDLNLQKIE